MISIFKLLKRYFITIIILIILIQIIISIFMFISSYSTIEKNTKTMITFTSLTLSDYEKEVMLKMNRINGLFNEIKLDIIRNRKYDINDIMMKIGLTENPKNFMVTLIDENGRVIDTNIAKMKDIDLNIYPDMKKKLSDAKDTERLYLDFPVYNDQVGSFFAYILQYIPEMRSYLQIGYKIDILNELLSRVYLFNQIQDFSYNISIYYVRFYDNNGYIYSPLLGGDRKGYLEILNNILKKKVFEYEESSLSAIKIAHLLTLRDWSSPYGIFYVIEVKPHLYGILKHIIFLNVMFSLIYLALYTYYYLNIKKRFVKPLEEITNSIANSTPIVHNKSSEIYEIELLKNSYLDHLANIKLKDLLKEVLIAQEKERERISRDLHDTVLQDLNYILIELTRNNMKSFADILKEDIKSLRSLVIESDMLKLKKFGLEAFINEFLEEMGDKFKDINFNTEIDLSGISFDQERNLLISRIIKELVLNAAIHSRGKNISLKIKKDNGNLIVIVKDDGMGFDFEEGYAKKGHIGLKLLKERVYVLNGEIKVITDYGTEIVITIPI